MLLKRHLNRDKKHDQLNVNENPIHKIYLTYAVMKATVGGK